MRWLFLLLVISCGQNEEPKALDLRDSDGDQVLNYQETAGRQFIADYEPLQKVTGVMTFTSQRQIQLTLSNDADKIVDVKDMLANPNSKEGEFFTEWSNLNLEKIDLNLADQKYFQVSFHFDEPSVRPTEIILITGNQRKLLAKWERHLRVQLIREDLENIMKGKSTLSIRKSFTQERFFDQSTEETIKSKTSRLYFHDDNTSRILYVSKEIDTNSLLEELGITNAMEISNEILFFNGEELGEARWFYRSLRTGGIIIAKTTIQDIKARFRAFALRTKSVLSRENGLAASSASFSLEAGDLLYMKVRPRQLLRDFSVSTHVTKHQIGGGKEGSPSFWRCTRYVRNVSRELGQTPSIDLFLGELAKFVDEGPITWKEQEDTVSPYWEISIKAKEGPITLSLPSFAPDTFTRLGEYDHDCKSRGESVPAGILAHPEAYLIFEIESFVEKMI
jgi:hypothetical protein